MAGSHQVGGFPTSLLIDSFFEPDLMKSVANQSSSEYISGPRSPLDPKYEGSNNEVLGCWVETGGPGVVAWGSVNEALQAAAEGLAQERSWKSNPQFVGHRRNHLRAN